MEIVWSKLAYEHFLEILIYVENNFGMLTAQNTSKDTRQSKSLSKTSVYRNYRQ